MLLAPLDWIIVDAALFANEACLYRLTSASVLYGAVSVVEAIGVGLASASDGI